MTRTLHRLARALLRAALPRELRDPVLGDLDDERQEQLAAGVEPREADSWAAWQAFGSLPGALRLRATQTSGTATAFSGGHTMHGLWQDIRYAARVMRKHPLMTAAAVATLALGIGATTAIFSVVHAALLRELPFHEPERIVRIYESFRGNLIRGVANPSNFDFWERHATSFSHIAATRTGRLTLTGAGDPAQLPTEGVTPSFFDTVGISPAIGRRLTDADAGGAVLLSHDLWRTRLGADPDVTTRTITLDGTARPVAGVMPAGFRFPHDTDVWEALPLPAEVRAEGRSWYLGVIARLKPGVTVAEAGAEMHALAAQLRDVYPARQKERGAWVIGLHEDLVARVAEGLKLLQGAVVLVLLIAIANVANLLLAHATVRGREFAIRAAVGASRLRLLRQLLTESLMLGLLGGAIGCLLAVWGVRTLIALYPLRLPPGMEPSVDGAVLAFTLGTSVAASVLFGVAPAVLGSRVGGAGTSGDAPRPIAVGAGATGGGFRSGLVVAEVALAVVLLVGAGLLMRSFGLLMAQQVGFVGDRVLTATTMLPSDRYDTPERRARFWQELFARLVAIPGVTAAGGSTALPFSNYEWQTSFRVAGREEGPAEPTSIRTVHPGYFETLGVPILSGRGFDARDGIGGERAVIVNETFAQTYLSGLDPIGQRIRFSGTPAPPPAVIVGVAGNTRHYRLTEPPAPEVYRPLAQQPPQQLVVAVRTAQDPQGAVSLLRAAIRDVDPDLPVEQVLTMDALVARTVADRRFYLTLMGFFSVLALGLALLGVYSVMAYVAGRRTREIGVRMALGATPRQVRRSVLAPGAVLIGTGIALGTGAALLASRMLESLLFGIAPNDPVTVTLSVAVLGAATLAAAYLPARRAGRLNPAVALRQD